MRALLPFFDPSLRGAMISGELERDQIQLMLRTTLPSCYINTLYENIFEFDTAILTELFIQQPHYGFLESEFGKKLLDESENLQLASGMLTTISVDDVLQEMSFSAGNAFYRGICLKISAFTTLLHGYSPSNYQLFIKIGQAMLLSDDHFAALYEHAMRAIASQPEYQQAASVLTLFYPVLAENVPNVHIEALSAELTPNSIPLAFHALQKHYDAIIQRSDFGSAMVITKLMLQHETNGVLGEHFLHVPNIDEVIDTIKGKVSRRAETERLTKNAKKFRENYDGPIVDFIKQNELQFDVLFEILSRNPDDLEQFFAYKIETVEVIEQNPFLRIIRECLADFLLSGEGEAVEKVMNVLAKVVSKALTVDQRSCLYVVCGCTMINTQFDYDLQGKKLQHYIFKDNFVKMMHDSPDIDKQYFTAEYLEEIYDSLKYSPLGVNHDIFRAISCEFMTVDTAIVTAIPEFASLLPYAQKDKPNYSNSTYFLRTEEHLRAMSLEDNRFAIVPILLEHAIQTLEVSMDIGQIEYYARSLVQYSNSCPPNSDGVAILNTALALITLTGLLNHPVLVENDVQAIRQLISNTQFGLKIAILSATALKLTSRVLELLTEEELRMLAILVLNLQILGFSNVFQYSAVDYYAVLAESQQLETVRQGLNFTYILAFNDFKLFRVLYKPMLEFLKELPNALDVYLYDNVKYLIFTHVSQTLEPIPASKSIVRLQASQRYQYLSIQAFVSMCVHSLENSNESFVGAFVSDVCENVQEVIQTLPLAAQERAEKLFEAKFDFSKSLSRLKTAVLTSCIGALATADVLTLYKQIRVELKLSDYMAIQMRLHRHPRYRHTVQEQIPALFVFPRADSTELAAACIASIVSDDVLGFRQTLLEVQNLSSLYFMNQMLGLADINLTLLKESKKQFFGQLQPVKFQPVQKEFVATSISEHIDQHLLQQINRAIAECSEHTVGLLIGAMLLQVGKIEDKVKIRLGEEEIGLTELVIAIVCLECGVDLIGERWEWVFGA